MGTLITVTELVAALEATEQQRPVLVDVRWELGAGRDSNHRAYLQGHLPGATFLDLEEALSDPVSADGKGGRHPMPSMARVQEAFRAAGLREGRPVVFYDAARSLAAARAWWIATYFEVEDASVLDGGLAAWVAAGHPVETTDVSLPEGNIELQGGGRDLLDGPMVQRWLDSAAQVLDARPAPRYRGENETIDPVAGHIPGALSVPALSALEPDGRFVSAQRLQELMEAAGADTQTPSVIYCGSGVQAAHLALALEARELGPQAPAVYVGSWSDWITDPERPVATGPDAR